MLFPSFKAFGLTLQLSRAFLPLSEYKRNVVHVHINLPGFLGASGETKIEKMV